MCGRLLETRQSSVGVVGGKMTLTLPAIIIVYKLIRAILRDFIRKAHILFTGLQSVCYFRHAQIYSLTTWHYNSHV